MTLVETPSTGTLEQAITLPAGTGQSELERFRSQGIRFLRVCHPDLFGRQRAKQFPINSLPGLLDDGVAYSKMSLAEDLFGVPVDESEFPGLQRHPDLHAQLDLSTAVLPPWEPDTAWVLTTLTEGEQPSPLCGRSQLARARALLEELDLTGQAAGEPEFYLFEKGVSGERPRPYATEGVSYTMDRITDPRGIVQRMHRALSDFGIGVSAVNREFSPGQFEINLAHGEAGDAADQVFLLKTAIKELAIIEGVEAVFMPKPLMGEEGSSLHVHLSLWQGNKNAFATEEQSLSDLHLAAIAGVQAHAAAILAFAAPTVNSYKRLHGNGLSPKTSNFAEDNRHTFIRVPAERGSATRFEVRAGDASASSHLLIAAIMHAARDGIVRGLRPTAEGVPLPRTLEAAVTALENDEFFTESFGTELVAVYAAIKRREVAGYEAAVTDWEWNVYHSQS